ncbi:MAG: HAMP domain-containing histidine kinase [Xanthobacteraceae bacterium]|nr:HAMP domain-containing histidine kinase [Xanthobacteraceae bacterium]
MNALGKLFHTTAFKLTLVYLTVFAVFAACLLGYFAWNTRRLITEQITRTVDAEITGLSEQYNQGGIQRLVFIIDTRARRPGSSLYLVTTFSGDGLAGNVGVLGEGVLEHVGWTETVYRRLDDPEGTEHHALVRVFQLPSGFRLLVGRDLEERERLYDIILAAGQWSIAVVIVLGLAGGFIVARRVLRRVDAMTETARTIMAGDLSGRLPTAGSEDELDRLAVNLNLMLERIEALMRGFKEVSDNIAHDLKTPLTRLRNRAEGALRTAKSDGDYRAALESTIEESDELIRTFNALLMIARAESGQSSAPMTEFDAADIVRGVGELYDPLADEKGLMLRVDVDSAALMRGNRELVTQALANLVDNAIKYGSRGERAANGVPAEIAVRAASEGDVIRLSVADRGPGIPEKDRGHAVERFVRLEQSRSEPGSGLGLSLASAVAHLHGGELKLEDNGPGLKASLVLPRGGPQLPQPTE